MTEIHTNDIFMTTKTGQFHWSVHFVAGGHPNEPVYLWQGQRVYLEALKITRANRRYGVRVVVKNVDGRPQSSPIRPWREFAKLEPIGTLGSVVFGGERSISL